MNYDPQKAFPYPVLRPNSNDYLNVDFQGTVDLAVGEGTVHATFKYELSCTQIAKEIAERRADFVSVVSCRDTYYRQLIASECSTCEADFQIADLRGEVHIDPFVVVRKKIPTFYCSDINPEFGEMPFSFSPGDILAQDEPQVFFIDREMFKPVTSVFELVSKDDLNNGEWRIGFEEDHVQIAVSPRMKETIDNARNTRRNKAVLLNSIYFAAVMETVAKLRESREEFEGKKWAEIILRQAHNKGCNIETQDGYDVAQRLMQFPLIQLKSVFLEGADLT